MHTNENIIADVEEETIVEASIVHVKAHGNTTTSGRDCTVRTAGLDPDPIGDSGTFLVVGTVAPKLQSPNTHQMSKGAYLEEFCLNHKDTGQETPCITISACPEHASKWNQSNRSSDKGVTHVTSWVIPNLPDLDISALIEGFRPNQEELSYEPNCSGILIHQRTRENWIHLNAVSNLDVMNFTNRWICFRPNCPSRPKIALHSPTQKRSRPRTTWRVFMGLPWIQQAKYPTKWPLDHQIEPNILKRVDLVPFIATPRSNGSKSSSTRVWRPGETLWHLSKLRNTFPCTGTHWIRRIPLQDYLPYPDAFTLGAINHQRLFAFECYDLGHFYGDQNVPEKLTYPLKPSRYKATSHLPYFGDLIIIVQRLVFYVFAICFLFSFV